jgi:hypothetical protein
MEREEQMPLQVKRDAPYYTGMMILNPTKFMP